jgi:nucleoside 2-deoxyribosyltransferase
MKVYLAGPEVFLPDAVAHGQRKKDICARHALTGLFPLDNEIDPKSKDASQRIFRGNSAMMREAGAIIANLTPFRGPSADAGTLYELGFMAGSGKLCFGYSNMAGDYRGKVETFRALAANIDDKGFTIEDFELPENLMVVHALEEFGCPLIVHAAPAAELWHDLSAFESCVHLLAERQITTRARRGRA